MKYAIFCLIFTAAICLGGEDVDGLYTQGLDALRAGQNVAAVKALAKAADLAEAAGDDAKATEIGSCLYWAKKRFTVTEAATLHQTDEKAEKKAEAVIAKKIEPSDADKWLERAQKFAAAHQDDQLRCAIALFEVADRFPMTTAGRTAMSASLAAMGKIKSEPVKVQAKVAPPVKFTASKGVSIEASEYTIETMKDGASVFSNQSGSSWKVIPEIDGKNYTQVPSGKPDGIKLRFNAAERIFFLIDPSWAPTRNNTAALKKIGGVLEKSSVIGGVNKHQVWSLIGRPGQIVDLPVQIIVVCDKIILEKIQ